MDTHWVFELLVGLIGCVIAVVLLFVYLLSIVWAYHDAEDRGKSGILVVLLVALASWPIGFLVWLVVRPEKLVSHDSKKSDPSR